MLGYAPYSVVVTPDYISDRDRMVGRSVPHAEIPHGAITLGGRSIEEFANSDTNSVETLAAKLEYYAEPLADLDCDVAAFLAERMFDLAQRVRERGLATVKALLEDGQFRY